MGFYIGKKEALYYQRPNGSLSRFGIRLSPNGIRVFDHLTRKWNDLPGEIPVRGGGSLTIVVMKSEEGQI
jgi:hypothetical protein